MAKKKAKAASGKKTAKKTKKTPKATSKAVKRSAKKAAAPKATRAKTRSTPAARKTAKKATKKSTAAGARVRKKSAQAPAVRRKTGQAKTAARPQTRKVPKPLPPARQERAQTPVTRPSEVPRGEEQPRIYEPEDLPNTSGGDGPELEFGDDGRDRPFYDTEGPATPEAEEEDTEAEDRTAPSAGEGRLPSSGEPEASARMPQVGDLAPDFELPDAHGETHRLSTFRGERVVLFFYPKDDTPGCTREACGFRDTLGEFEELNTTVLGISPDSSASHDAFARKFGLTFTLLADEGHEVAERYGVWGPKQRPGGATTEGVHRTTFVINEDGRIGAVYPQVQPEGHERELLAWLSTQE